MLSLGTRSALLTALGFGLGLAHARPVHAADPKPAKVAHRTVKIDGLDIFYREVGPKDAPTILLLHGFPASSHMFRNLIPALADEFHVVAPDYPGFGHSSAPPVDKFEYTFDKLAEVVEKFTEKVGLKNYALYVQDYGAPVGYRLANMPVVVPHSFKNESDQPARMLISVAPAGLEQMFFEFGVPVEQGAMTAPPPTKAEIEKLLEVAPRYGIEIKLPGH